jgi:cell division septation protein DedD
VKERLTGAMILVALIVLLVPELLTGPLRATTKAAGTDSSTEEAPLRSYTINLADDGHAPGSPPSVTEEPAPPAPLPGAAVPASHAAAPVPVPAPSPASKAAPPEQTPEAAPRASPTPMARPVTPPPAAGGWVVQLGSFASEGNADRLAQQVRGQGFPVSVSQSASGRHLYRVRVGPVHEHTAALQLAQKLSADGHAGTVEPR